jgi:YVTN family beta-propeller protein
VHLPRSKFAAALLLIYLCLADALGAAEVSLKDQPHLRRPVAAAWVEENKILAVANQRSGSVSIVDIEKYKVVAEVAVGEKLADVASLPSPGWLLAADEKLHELLVLHWEAGQLQIIERIPVSRYPVSIAVSQDGSHCTVASLWSRKMTTFGVDASEGTEPKLTKRDEVEMAFAPRGQLFMPDNRHVLVTDAFTGQMALVDVVAPRAVKIPAKHIFRIFATGLSPDEGRFRIAHQITQRPMSAAPKIAKSQLKDLVNYVGEYSIAGLLDGRLEPFAVSGFFPRDLREVTELESGSFTISFRGGVQLLNPVAGQSQVFVRRFSDELLVTDADKPTKKTTIPLGPVGVLTAADRGEALFHNAKLSATRWMSCHGCHPDGHTTGQRADTQGENLRLPRPTKGTHKRILTLLGSSSTEGWTWTGEVTDLNSQVIKALETTMGKPTNPQIVSDLTAFIQTLPPPPPLKPATDDPTDKAQLARGEGLFRSHGCANCHVPALGYTSNDAYDVGLEDEKGRTTFNPPSLRGVSQGYSFFHDGRATKLEEVLTTHLHPRGKELPADEVADLVRFLSSL